MGTDSSSSSTASVALGAKGAARTVAQHHQAVVGFLVGFFLVMLLYTIMSSQFRSPSAIGLLLSTPAVRTDQNAMTAPGSPSSTPSNLAQGDYTKQDNGQKSDTNDNMEERIEQDVHRIDKKDQNKTKFADEQGKKAEQSGEPVTDASDRMEEELIRQEIDQGGNNKDTNIEPAAPRKPICDLSDPRYDICEMSSDARAMGTNRTVLYIPPVGERGGDSQEWSIPDQSRKYLEYSIRSRSGR